MISDWLGLDCSSIVDIFLHNNLHNNLHNIQAMS